MIDGHQDIAWNALEFGRDPRQSAYTLRLQEMGGPAARLLGERTTGLPEYLNGRVGIIFATLFVMPAENAFPGFYSMTYNSPQQAKQRAMEQVDYYRQLAAQEPRFRLVVSSKDLEAVVSSWIQPGPGQPPQVGLVMLMEGADPILTPQDLPKWHELGLRMVGPAWHATRYSASAGAPGPLSDLGRQLLAEMANLNIILDISHLAPAAALEALDSYAGPLMASHSNAHPFLPTDRGLSDEMIQKLAARGGVIGINLYNRYLLPGWQHGDSRAGVTLDTVAAAMDYVVQLAGSAENVAIGSDFDGGFGLDAIPSGMDTCADFLLIAEALEKRGYTREDIEKVMNGNWLRLLRQGLNE